MSRKDQQPPPAPAPLRFDEKEDDAGVSGGAAGAAAEEKRQSGFSSPAIAGLLQEDKEQLDTILTDFFERLRIVDDQEKKNLVRRLESLLELEEEERAEEEAEENALPARPLSTWFSSTLPPRIPGIPTRELENHATIKTPAATIPFGKWMVLVSPHKLNGFDTIRGDGLYKGYKKKASKYIPRPPQSDGMYELAVGLSADSANVSAFYIGEAGNLYWRLLYQYAKDGNRFIEEALRCELYIFARWVESKDTKERPNNRTERVELQDKVIGLYDYAINKVNSSPRRGVYVENY